MSRRFGSRDWLLYGGVVFLIDKQGKVRCCVEMRDLQEQVKRLLGE